MTRRLDLINFLRRQGCYSIDGAGETITFTTPNALAGSATFHRGGAITETIDGQVNEYTRLSALKRAWREGHDQVGIL